MNVQHRSFSLVGVGGQGLSGGASTWIVSVPFLLNTVPVKAGEELVWRQLEEKPKAEIKTKRTWKEDRVAQAISKKKRDQRDSKPTKTEVDEI